MKSWINTAVFALLLPRVAATCTGFNFTDPQNGRGGRLALYNTTFPTTAFVNCTAANAIIDPANQNGDNNTCRFHRYGMGLVVHPDVRFVSSVDNATAANIWTLAYQAAGTAAANVNFNATIVMNHTTVQSAFFINEVGYLEFVPLMRCFDGRLSECSDSSSSLEGKTVRACGLLWLDERQKFLPPGEQQYNGDERLVKINSTGDRTGTQDPQPAYEDVSGQATFSQPGVQNTASDSSLRKENVALGISIGVLALILNL